MEISHTCSIDEGKGAGEYPKKKEKKKSIEVLYNYMHHNYPILFKTNAMKPK